ncbi:MAG TPA: glycerol-3-phosphate 1-O-acyltransferase PlsY [Thermotogota bacterium]|nr:glycerol-3-phosphate 1-O-acyltransferase PlsY [Thermotogota bacterium]HRW91720.1 glycerol-3-phosphate 1-O-acyltransferase PlsY [Thermotogota bacterium]
MGVLFVIILYFCGAFPFSYLVPKIWKGVDVRKVGSGNVGSTNVIRAVGKPIGGFCMILDALKVFLPLLVMKWVMTGQPHFSLWLSLAALSGVMGHDFSIFLRGRGGKGVASTMGAFFGIHLLSGSLFLALATTIALSTRLMSLGSLVGLVASTLIIFPLTHDWYYLALYLFLTLFSFYQHRKNLIRLWQGKENPF